LASPQSAQQIWATQLGYSMREKISTLIFLLFAFGSSVHAQWQGFDKIISIDDEVSEKYRGIDLWMSRFRKIEHPDVEVIVNCQIYGCFGGDAKFCYNRDYKPQWFAASGDIIPFFNHYYLVSAATSPIRLVQISDEAAKLLPPLNNGYLFMCDATYQLFYVNLVHVETFKDDTHGGKPSAHIHGDSNIKDGKRTFDPKFTQTVHEGDLVKFYWIDGGRLKDNPETKYHKVISIVLPDPEKRIRGWIELSREEVKPPAEGSSEK
jgi:hypothetical protein